MLHAFVWNNAGLILIALALTGFGWWRLRRKVREVAALQESVDRRFREVAQEQADQRRRAERLQANLSVRQTLANDWHVEDGHE